tara:strand:- start:746 stop:1534 length:789 start_codon:yes stop_codon:yes gene_type:complete
MKAIILAAGMGTRLNKYTKRCPKGLLDFDGISLLERQINTIRKVGINDITIVKGYMEEMFNFQNVSYCINERYSDTNMVESLLCVKEDLVGDCIVTYSDIIYDSKLLKKVIGSQTDIGVTVDQDYLDYWILRLGDDYLSDMESLVVEDGCITNIGKSNPNSDEALARYIGIIKFSAEGLDVMKKYYNHFKSKNYQSKWGSRTFVKWHMTDLLQALIDVDVPVNPIFVSKGWLEFDTENDYELYNKWLENGQINNFINLDNSV